MPRAALEVEFLVGLSVCLSLGWPLWKKWPLVYQMVTKPYLLSYFHAISDGSDGSDRSDSCDTSDQKTLFTKHLTKELFFTKKNFSYQ